MKPTPKKDPTTSVKKRAKKILDHEQELVVARRLLQVEAALEKVREKALQMKLTDELKEVISIIFKEMGKLGFDLYDTNIAIVDKATKDITFYGSGLGGVEMPPEFKVPYLPGEEPYFDQVYQDIERRKRFNSTVLQGKRLQDYHKFALEKTDFKNAPTEYLEGMLSVKKVVLSYATMSHGFLEVASDEALADDKIEILKRFARVVDLTYTRFDDLQKAEAQAREAQIEAALERVRARTMAMQRSGELAEAATLLFQQVKALGITQWTCGFCIFDIDDKEFTWYPGGPDGEILQPSKIPLLEHPIFRQFNESRKRGDELHIYEKSGEVQEDHYRYMLSLPVVGEYLQSRLDAGEEFPAFQIDHLVNFSHGNLIFITYEHFPEMHDIFKRFAKVFEQTYTRFLDLQKAEGQAREAQIEAALERVRSVSMAMHESDELVKVATTVYQQLIGLGFDSVVSGGFNFPDAENKVTQCWFAETTNESLLQNFKIPFAGDKVLDERHEYRGKGIPFLEQVLKREEVEKHMEFVFPNDDSSDEELAAREAMPDPTIFSIQFLNEGYMILISVTPLSEDQKSIMGRFANVFNSAYTRFLDLQKAEEQAREAQIEAALERVRSRSVTMRKSKEIADIAGKIFSELRQLDLVLNRVLIWTFNDTEKYTTWWSSNPEVESTAESYRIDYNDNPVFINYLQAWQQRKPVYLFTLSGDTKKSWEDHLFEHTEMSRLPMAVRKGMRAEGTLYTVSVISDYGLMMSGSFEPLSEVNIDIIQRFGRVFQQSYTRYLDVQKAEAQAREGEIQLALERVRAQTMAMYSSKDIGDCILKMFSELTSLGVDEGTRFGIGILNHDNENNQLWTARKEGEEVKMHIGNLDMTSHPLLKSARKAWKEQVPLHRYILEGDDLLKYYQMINTAPDYKLRVSIEKLPEREFHYGFIFDHGFFYAFSLSEFQQNLIQIAQRFSAVFEQTYRRFLDLQKAEAQAREAEIQLALERVRAKTMAMQSSSELADASFLMANQVRELGIKAWGCAFHIYADNEEGDYEWFSSEQGYLPFYKTPREGVFKRYYDNRQSGESLYIEEFSGEACTKHYEYLMTLSVVGDALRSLRDSGVPLPTSQIDHVVYFSYGYLLFITYEPVLESYNIFKRFAKEFEQTYTRFLDLQKAEAQAREAQIETGLERVRAQAMAMHHSDDLGLTIEMFYEQMSNLLDTSIIRCGAGLLNKVDSMAEIATASKDTKGKIFNVKGNIDMTGHPLLKNTIDHWRDQKEYYHVLKGEEIKKYYQYMTNQVAIPDYSDDEEQHFYFPMFSEGSFYVITKRKLNVEELRVVRRFSSVLSLTYRRFNDLKKAEVQAREAQIEASLEKVRGKAMAMRNSDDLSLTASMVFTELRNLGIRPIRCGVGLFNKKSRKVQLYSATSTNDGDSLALIGWVVLSGHPVFEKIYDGWLKNEEYYPEMSGEQLKSYYDLLLKGFPIEVSDLPEGQKHYGHFLPFSVGCLYAWSNARYNDTELNILKRFAAIIDLTFRRYFELQKSEANAREAIKQAALDRIRAEIASMRTSEDLNRITPVIWQELNTLEVPFFRCGVFIVDDEAKKIDAYLSNPRGESLAAWRSDYDTLPLFKASVKAWKKQQVYQTEWDKKQFLEFSQILVDQGLVQDVKRYRAGKDAPDYLSLQMFPFKQGMLYVGSAEKLKDDQIELVQVLVSAFSIAYSRYEDFRQLEMAKSEVEQTLSELKSTQNQLIHSEKMASLGELTAGIAHEIQNPLNFVNNFSEVSKELIEELKEERAKMENERDEGLEIEIIEDIIQNLEKINHHGQRASSIVKGMLEHSRSGTNKKELTDINLLADEYLRLAYHGLRAKDKTFQADFKLDLDSSLPKIMVIGQEIGRVLLNLINNAFYAVSKKGKSSLGDYVPTVIVQTKKQGNIAEIRVKDNAEGIPASVVDKIFQPFFTTKPTGMGTGLGLSLSYDIITKGHDGHLEVDTQEGIGTEFIIQIPIT